MRSTIYRPIALAVSLVALCTLTSPANAAGGKKKNKKAGAASGRVLARFDRNHDGSLDSQESQRVIAVYSALSALDTDHNGSLSESEVAAAKVAPAGKKAAKKPKTSN